MEYNFKEIEQRWQAWWKDQGLYTVKNGGEKPKFYVLDMFPYPSGAGLHVGHPLGYIASDIYSRYKRLQGFNVLHPMGFDSYGLPAEQYAIQTGTHPEETTYKNIKRYCEQLNKIGFCYDWDREVRTCEPGYYRWTQWAFEQMFKSYYDQEQDKAMPIENLIRKFEKEDPTWKTKSEKEQQEILMHYRLAYLADLKVNWCPKLGTVLANDEVSEGLSVRGGYPVEQRVMKQWSLRVSAYAQRLLDGLEKIDWTESLKETQRNWIGRSEGAEMIFQVKGQDEPVGLKIFTTRCDTVFGVTFMVVAPEYQGLDQLVTEEQRAEVTKYCQWAKNRTERERIADRRVSGCFTGSYAINPLTQQEIPIYVSDYVLVGYGTGAIMAVPAHDSRDYAFARHFNLPVIPLIEGADVSEESFDAKEGVMINSGFLNGLQVKDAIKRMKQYIEQEHIGRVRVNYRLRDAIFSRQRYWGEPFPVYYKQGMPYLLPESALPLQLPEVKDFKPTETGEPPLGNAQQWAWDEQKQQVVDKALIDEKTVFPLELNTMPGFAGSSAYYLRYMDNHNTEALVSREANQYWRQVDLYIGGTEHATGHLIYSRFWNKFLYDRGVICEDEPFKKLINQGMIQGRSNFVYRWTEDQSGNTYVSAGLLNQEPYKGHTQPIHVNVNLVTNDVLDIEAFKQWMPEYKDAKFILEDGKYVCGWAVEKMSKSMFNVVNPDDIVEKYGADTLRLYEMFLGPLEMSKPWDTAGIDGVYRFLKRFWALYADALSQEEPTREEMKVLHGLIKKVSYDIEHFSFNTSIPAFMIARDELAKLNCHKQLVLEPMLILLTPFAPHLAEELWHRMGHETSVLDAQWPTWDEKYLEEQNVKYPVQFRGKVRFTLELPKSLGAKDVEARVLADEQTARYLDGNPVKKVIVVPGRIVNIVY